MTRSPIRLVRNASLLALGLIAGSTAIRDFTPEPNLRDVSAKLAHIAENPDTYDILFVGSSRVFRQISPTVFDQRLRTHGLDLRSFNAGIPAAKSVEVWHFLRRLGDLGETRARYIVIEPDGLLATIARENFATEREIYWHGPAETGMAIRSLGELQVVPRIRMSFFHTGTFLFNRLAVGRLRLLGSQLGRPSHLRRADPGGLGPDGDGWMPFVKAEGQPDFERRREFLGDLPRYRRMLARQPRLLSGQDCLTEYHAEMLGHLTAAVEALGAEPVFVLSPATQPRCEVHQAFREGLLPNLIAFDDAATFPELYDVHNRFDFEHLNTRGAALYSRLLADRFADSLREHGEGGGV
jgi:hypothetical protein